MDPSLCEVRLKNAVRLFTVENTRKQPDREKVLMLIREADQVSVEEVLPDEPSYSLSLVDVGDRQQYRRTANVIEFLGEQALLNKCTLNKLLGVVLKQVNVEEYKKFCIETYEFLLDNFSNTNRWISISPTLHSLLAHSWEIISANDGVGLGEYTEGGLENSNKFLRFYRIRLSRKNSQSSNLYDCITRLWLRGDPAIRGSKPTSRVYKKKVSEPQRSFVDRHLEKLLEM